MSGELSLRSLRKLERAVTRLGAALDAPTEELAIDGTIQRFEFTFELYWKTAKRVLGDEGIDASTPRQVLQEAFTAGLISDEAVWLQMLQDRNQAAHTYDEVLAREIYARIRAHYPAIEAGLLALRERLRPRAEPSP